MALQIGTQGSTGYAGRGTNVVNYNSAYTVLFSFYLPSDYNYDFLWGLGGSTGSNSNTNLGTRGEVLKPNGAGTSVKLTLWDGTNGDETIFWANPAATTWHNIAIIRSSATAIKVRYNGTNSSTLTLDISGREAVANEFLGYGGDSARAGVRWTNYKAWSAALSDPQVDAEHATTSFIVTANKFSGSPMGDESTAAGNNTADGSGATWTLGAGMSYGNNSPDVTYGGAGQSRPFSGKLGGLFKGKLG